MSQSYVEEKGHCLVISYSAMSDVSQSQLTAHSPKILTLAAAEQANQEGNDDNSTNHCEGDYQRLEVHCRCTQRDMTAKVFKNPQ